MKHKHCEVIKAWADGAQIQFRTPGDNSWTNIGKWAPSWNVYYDYRVNPKKKQLWVRPYKSRSNGLIYVHSGPTQNSGEDDVVGTNWVGPAVLVWEEK